MLPRIQNKSDQKLNQPNTDLGSPPYGVRFYNQIEFDPQELAKREDITKTKNSFQNRNQPKLQRLQSKNRNLENSIKEAQIVSNGPSGGPSRG